MRFVSLAFLFSLFFTQTTAIAVSINFDFGANVNNTGNNRSVSKLFNAVDYDRNGFGDYWNQFGIAPPGINYGGIVDVSGVEVSRAWFALNQVTNLNHLDTTAPSALQWGNALGVPNEVLPSLYFDNPSTPLMNFVFGGLKAGSKWRVEVFSVLNDDNQIDVSVNGAVRQAFNRGRFFTTFDSNDARMIFENVRVGNDGLIGLNVIRTSGQFWPAIQAVRISVVPEPTTAAIFLTLSAICGVGYRKRLVSR